MAAQDGVMIEKIGGMTAQVGVVVEKKGEMIAHVGEWPRKSGNGCASWEMAAQIGERLRR